MLPIQDIQFGCNLLDSPFVQEHQLLILGGKMQQLLLVLWGSRQNLHFFHGNSSFDIFVYFTKFSKNNCDKRVNFPKSLGFAAKQAKVLQKASFVL